MAAMKETHSEPEDGASSDDDVVKENQQKENAARGGGVKAPVAKPPRELSQISTVELHEKSGMSPALAEAYNRLDESLTAAGY